MNLDNIAEYDDEGSVCVYPLHGARVEFGTDYRFQREVTTAKRSLGSIFMNHSLRRSTTSKIPSCSA